MTALQVLQELWSLAGFIKLQLPRVKIAVLPHYAGTSERGSGPAKSNLLFLPLVCALEEKNLC